MDYYLPEKPNSEFQVTLVAFVLAMLVSIGLGIFTGYGIRLFLGNDEDVALTYTYTERLSAAKTVFSQENYEFQVVASQIRYDEGLRILRASDGTPLIVTPEGELYTPEVYFTQISPVEDQTGSSVSVTTSENDGSEVYSQTGEETTLTAQDVIDALNFIFSNTDTALADYEDSAGDPVTDLELWNIAVGADANVYFYLYYDYAGYLSVAYNESDDFSERLDPIRIISQWYFDYGYTPSR